MSPNAGRQSTGKNDKSAPFCPYTVSNGVELNEFPGPSGPGVQRVKIRVEEKSQKKVEKKIDISTLFDSLSGPLRLRVQSRSRTPLRIAASIAFLFRACFKEVLDTIAPLSRG